MIMKMPILVGALQQLNTEKSITDQFYSVYMAQSNLGNQSRRIGQCPAQSYDIIKKKVEADLAAKDESLSGRTESLLRLARL